VVLTVFSNARPAHTTASGRPCGACNSSEKPPCNIYIYIYIYSLYILVCVRLVEQPYGRIFVLGASLENMFSPKGWQRTLPNYKILKSLDLIICTMALAISTCKSNAQKCQMFSKVSPTCFEGLSGRTIKCRNTGPENWD